MVVLWSSVFVPLVLVLAVTSTAGSSADTFALPAGVDVLYTSGELLGEAGFGPGGAFRRTDRLEASPLSRASQQPSFTPLVVAEPSGWLVESFVFYPARVNAPPNPLHVQAYRLQVWNGVPEVIPALETTRCLWNSGMRLVNSSADQVQFTGAFLTSSAGDWSQAVMRLFADTTSDGGATPLYLPQGTYYLALELVPWNYPQDTEGVPFDLVSATVASGSRVECDLEAVECRAHVGAWAFQVLGQVRPGPSNEQAQLVQSNVLPWGCTDTRIEHLGGFAHAWVAVCVDTNADGVIRQFAYDANSNSLLPAAGEVVSSGESNHWPEVSVNKDSLPLTVWVKGSKEVRARLAGGTELWLGTHTRVNCRPDISYSLEHNAWLVVWSAEDITASGDEITPSNVFAKVIHADGMSMSETVDFTNFVNKGRYADCPSVAYDFHKKRWAVAFKYRYNDRGNNVQQVFGHFVKFNPANGASVGREGALRQLSEHKNSLAPFRPDFYRDVYTPHLVYMGSSELFALAFSGDGLINQQFQVVGQLLTNDLQRLGEEFQISTVVRKKADAEQPRLASSGSGGLLYVAYTTNDNPPEILDVAFHRVDVDCVAGTGMPEPNPSLFQGAPVINLPDVARGAGTLYLVSGVDQDSTTHLYLMNMANTEMCAPYAHPNPNPVDHGTFDADVIITFPDFPDADCSGDSAISRNAGKVRVRAYYRVTVDTPPHNDEYAVHVSLEWVLGGRPETESMVEHSWDKVVFGPTSWEHKFELEAPDTVPDGARGDLKLSAWLTVTSNSDGEVVYQQFGQVPLGTCAVKQRKRS